MTNAKEPIINLKLRCNPALLARGHVSGAAAAGHCNLLGNLALLARGDVSGAAAVGHYNLLRNHGEEPRQPSFGLLVAEPDESLGAEGHVDAPAIFLGGGFDLVEPRFKRTNLQALETSILEPLQDLGRLLASRLVLEDEPE